MEKQEAKEAIAKVLSSEKIGVAVDNALLRNSEYPKLGTVDLLKLRYRTVRRALEYPVKKHKAKSSIKPFETLRKAEKEVVLFYNSAASRAMSLDDEELTESLQVARDSIENNDFAKYIERKLYRYKDVRQVTNIVDGVALMIAKPKKQSVMDHLHVNYFDQITTVLGIDRMKDGRELTLDEILSDPQLFPITADTNIEFEKPEFDDLWMLITKNPKRKKRSA